MAIREADEVIEFWFGPEPATAAEYNAQGKRWFRGGPEMDAEVKARFGPLVDHAIAGGLEEWATDERGWLGLILVLDQLTRNNFRGDGRSWAGDARAQQLTIAALDDGRCARLPCRERHFAILPLLHAEDLALQERNVVEMAKLVAGAPPLLLQFLSLGIEQSHKYRDIIARFGRFPHRNAILGRASTPEELQFLRDLGDKMAPSGAAKLWG
jgi:uncharacterized protein (DUF924 family)